MVWLNLYPVAVAILEEVALYLQICNGYFHLVSEPWPMSLMFKTTSDFLIDQNIFLPELSYTVSQFLSTCFIWSTVDSRYLELYEHFEISVLRYIIFAELRKTINQQSPLTEWICNLTPELEIYWKYCGKDCEQFLLFSTIFCRLLVDLCVKTGTSFSLRAVIRDKRGRDNESRL